jgi:hypothetical protein
MNQASKHLRERAAAFRSAAVDRDRDAEMWGQRVAEARSDAAGYLDRAAEFERAADLLDPTPSEEASPAQEQAA